MAEKAKSSGHEEVHEKGQMVIVSRSFLKWPDSYASRENVTFC